MLVLNAPPFYSSFREDLGGRYEIHPLQAFLSRLRCTPPPAVHRQTQLRLNVNPGKTGADPQGRGETEEGDDHESSTSFEHELATLLINTAPVDYRYELNRRRKGANYALGRLSNLDDSPRSFRISPLCIHHRLSACYLITEFVLYLYPTRSSR